MLNNIYFTLETYDSYSTSNNPWFLLQLENTVCFHASA